MSKKTELQGNNADLQTVLDTINALPEILDTSNATAVAEDVRSGQIAYAKGEIIIGTMPDRSAATNYVNAGASYTIPKGYHRGTGKVIGNSLASQTSATAAAGDIRSGKTAWVNGAKVTGNASVLANTDIRMYADEGYKTFYPCNNASISSVKWQYWDHCTSNLTKGAAYLLMYNGKAIGYGVGSIENHPRIYFVNCGPGIAESEGSISVDLRKVYLYKV